MKFAEIMPQVSSMDERNTLIFGIVLSMFFTFIPTLIIHVMMPHKLTTSSKAIIVALLNFEIAVALLYILLPLIQFFGMMLVPIVSVCNLITCLYTLLAILNSKQVKIPVIYEFVSFNGGQIPPAGN